MARQRVYYTKDQVTEGLLTKGKQWMFVDGTEYVGQYHTYTTGEVYSESTYIDGKSEMLIPFENIKSNRNRLGISIAKNFEYDRIKKVKITPSLVPNSNRNTPIDDDYIRGYMMRYFASKVNEGRVIEISKDDFDSIGKSSALDKNQWVGFKIRWKISGRINDLKNQIGEIKEAGAMSTNKRTIDLIAETYPDIKRIIRDYREFYKR